ncbi:MAG: DUF983 domain-containing protein [Anaerolineae bacterium]|nr:DUF983 domain-containing protein [Anaerolineae bacterium]
MTRPGPLAILLRGALGLCPHCGRRSIFKGLYAAHERCPHCGLPLEDKPGEFTGTAYINAGLTGLVGVIFGVLMVLAFPGINLIFLTGLGVVVILLSATLLHRPIKGIWVAVLYASQAIEPPESR